MRERHATKALFLGTKIAQKIQLLHHHLQMPIVLVYVETLTIPVSSREYRFWWLGTLKALCWHLCSGTVQTN